MKFSINTKKRDTGDIEEIRAKGEIPAIVYGPEIEPVAVSVDYRSFEKLYTEAGESSLIDCVVEGVKDPITVLIQDLQHDPVKGKIIHVDFRQIKMGEEMSATIVLGFVGEAPAVKELGGTLNKATGQLNVKCLPRDLVGHIDVDLSTLKTFDDIIRIKDLTLPQGIAVLDDLETAVAKVIAPLTEEQFKAMEEEGEKGIEGVEVKGKEGEEKAVAGEEKKEEENKEDNNDKKKE